MDLKTTEQLEKAKALFYSWRLLEAYNLLKRFFDRIPFSPDKLHAEYIGIFARTLIELGKEFDLKFYLVELERIYSETKDPFVGYPLAAIYTSLSEPKFEVARTILETILQDPKAVDFHNRARMLLADYFDRKKKDSSACRMIIEMITNPRDEHEARLVEIWRAYIDRMEKKWDASGERMEKLLRRLTPKLDWYSYFSANLVLAMTYAETQQWPKARRVAGEIRKTFAGRYFKSIQIQLKDLDAILEKEERLGVMRYVRRERESFVRYANKTLVLKGDTPVDRLLHLLVKERMIDKSSLVRHLYGRHYSAGDDKLIYYHVHSLRKRLRELGLPHPIIRNSGDGYHLIPEVLIGKNKEEVLSE